MSQADRDRWNRRYREGAYAARTHPSAFLLEWLPRLDIDASRPRAVDVACGMGRNALALARAGWQVDAIDVADEALARLQETAAAEGLPITTIRSDLEPDEGNAAPGIESAAYDLVVVFRYTNLGLLERMRGTLRPGGNLIVELHLAGEADVVGPKDPRFRVAPGALRAAGRGLEIVDYREGVVIDPDGRRAALAQLVARRPEA